MTILLRFVAWSLLLVGLVAGIALPHPVTAALWTAAAGLFRRAGDTAMVARLISAPKFGPRIRRGMAPQPARLDRLARAF